MRFFTNMSFLTMILCSVNMLFLIESKNKIKRYKKLIHRNKALLKNINSNVGEILLKVDPSMKLANDNYCRNMANLVLDDHNIIDDDDNESN